MKSKHKFIYAKFTFAPHIIIIVLNCYSAFLLLYRYNCTIDK